ncbi:hypothetical protein CPB84DRAFT_1750903 [Gymnopilus junonius]|uniref:Uncharacterized protein n=1 Tax=Gymnopilus junonius TaxID=109634 RepID=A0A9P5NEX2_GYMJU|nr:hypothetical protein CPB84DRAFT_1750903 [Gymnopilus junonius]
MAHFSAAIEQGFTDAGGRNVTIILQNRVRSINTSAVVRMALFYHFQYWYPLALCASLAFSSMGAADATAADAAAADAAAADATAADAAAADAAAADAAAADAAAADAAAADAAAADATAAAGTVVDAAAAAGTVVDAAAAAAISGERVNGDAVGVDGAVGVGCKLRSKAAAGGRRQYLSKQSPVPSPTPSTTKAAAEGKSMDLRTKQEGKVDMEMKSDEPMLMSDLSPPPIGRHVALDENALEAEPPEALKAVMADGRVQCMRDCSWSWNKRGGLDRENVGYSNILLQCGVTGGEEWCRWYRCCCVSLMEERNCGQAGTAAAVGGERVVGDAVGVDGALGVGYKLRSKAVAEAASEAGR